MLLEESDCEIANVRELKDYYPKYEVALDELLPLVMLMGLRLCMGVLKRE